MGQKYAAYNVNGAIVGFYDSVDSPVPSGVTNVIAISEAQWLACLQTPGYTVVNGALVAPAQPSNAQVLAQAQTQRFLALRGACLMSIQSGFSSSALGSAYSYPSSTVDQITMLEATTLANAGTGSNLWCENVSGSWGFALHTPAQVIQVHRDWVAYRASQQQTLVSLAQQVAAAGTVTAVQAVVWP